MIINYLDVVGGIKMIKEYDLNSILSGSRKLNDKYQKVNLELKNNAYR